MSNALLCNSHMATECKCGSHCSSGVCCHTKGAATHLTATEPQSGESRRERRRVRFKLSLIRDRNATSDRAILYAMKARERQRRRLRSGSEWVALLRAAVRTHVMRCTGCGVSFCLFSNYPYVEWARQPFCVACCGALGKTRCRRVRIPRQTRELRRGSRRVLVDAVLRVAFRARVRARTWV